MKKIRSIADSIPVKADSGSRRQLHEFMRQFDVKSGALGGGFADAFALEGEAVRIVPEPIEIASAMVGLRRLRPALRPPNSTEDL